MNLNFKFVGAVFAFFLICLAFIHQKRFDSATPLSRLDLLHAVFVHGTLRIDNYDNTPDKAVFAGHTYSDKAPGTVALALVPFTFAVGLLWVTGVSLDSSSGWLFSSWVACVGSIGVITALGGGVLFAWLSIHAARESALLTTLTVVLGAAPLIYATMLFSHSLVVGCICIAIWALSKGAWIVLERGLPPCVGSLPQERGPEPRKQRRYLMLAGFACGWALASEFTAGLIIAGIFFMVLCSGWRSALVFSLAAIPPLLMIPAYSWACFGNPFVLPYSFQGSFPEMKSGLYAIGLPDATTAYRLLFGPTRGLFFWSPFLLMAFVGYPILFKRSQPLFWLTYAVPLLQIAVISGRVWDWQAGPTLGPRYLAPILPLLALPCALGAQRFPKIAISLAIYSIGITTIATLTNACPPGSIHNPLLEMHLPMFIKGEFSPNLGMVLGLPPFASVAVYYGILIAGVGWLWRRLGGLRAEAAPASSPATQTAVKL